MTLKYKRTPDVVKRKIAGELFLVPVKRKLADMQNLFVLHGCAEFIWDHIDGAADRQGLIAGVVGEFDISEEVASNDVDNFLELLSAEGLIELAG